MNRKIKITTISVLLVVAIGLASILGVTIYQAATAAAPVTGVLGHRGGADVDLKGSSDRESLAEALGISLDELNAAYESATQEAINQAVAAGLITQAQADNLLERAGVFSFHGGGKGWLGESDIDFEALLADALGISVETLADARQQAFQIRIDQAVADGKITEEEADLLLGREALYASDAFRASMQAAFEAAVQNAVEDGVITQSQADQILNNQDGAGFLNFHGGMRPHGRHGGFDGRMPEGRDSSESGTADSDGL